MKLQTFGSVYSHQLHCILSCLRLIITCFQSRMTEKSGQRCEYARVFVRTAGRHVGGVTLDLCECSRSRDQFVQVIHAIGALFFRFVMRNQTAVYDDVINQFRQRQMLCIKTHAINHAIERAQLRTRRATHG